jgi:hypothetical protein
MTHSDTINELAAALAKAQAAIKGATKDSDNPFFKSKYADLASVREACNGPLTANGLSVVQTPSTTPDGEVSVTTLLLHTSGQWIADTLTLSPKDDGPQAMGSAITYARRYALAAFTGVAPEDDDAEAAEGREVGKPLAEVKGNDAPVRVRSVKAEPTSNPNVVRYKVEFSDGRKAATIKQELGDMLKKHERTKEEDRPLILAHIARGKYGPELVEVALAPATDAQQPF